MATIAAPPPDINVGTDLEHVHDEDDEFCHIVIGDRIACTGARLTARERARLHSPSTSCGLPPCPRGRCAEYR